MDSVGGGGVVAEIFRDPYSVGGGGSSRNFPESIFCGVAEFFISRPSIRVFFPLTAITDPQFVLFKHVLCFARIMSTLCPNSCRQTARIGGGSCPPPLPPVPYAYGPSHQSMSFAKRTLPRLLSLILTVLAKHYRVSCVMFSRKILMSFGEK